MNAARSSVKNAQRCALIFGQPMQPCKCGGYDLAYQVPIKLDQPLPDDPRKVLSVWAKAKIGGATPLEGVAYIVCRACLHRGPSVDVLGRTSEDVTSDPDVAKEIKRLWNSQSGETSSC